MAERTGGDYLQRVGWGFFRWPGERERTKKLNAKYDRLFDEIEADEKRSSESEATALDQETPGWQVVPGPASTGARRSSATGRYATKAAATRAANQILGLRSSISENPIKPMTSSSVAINRLFLFFDIKSLHRHIDLLDSALLPGYGADPQLAEMKKILARAKLEQDPERVRPTLATNLTKLADAVARELPTIPTGHIRLQLSTILAEAFIEFGQSDLSAARVTLATLSFDDRFRDLLPPIGSISAEAEPGTGQVQDPSAEMRSESIRAIFDTLDEIHSELRIQYTGAEAHELETSLNPAQTTRQSDQPPGVRGLGDIGGM